MKAVVNFIVQVIPNLAANILWVAPLAWLQHRRLKHHHETLIDRLYDKIKDETEGPDRG